MGERVNKNSKFWAYVALITGLFLLLGGLVGAYGYLSQREVALGALDLGPQLGQMAAIVLGLVGGGLAAYHGWASIRGLPSRPLRLPHAFFFGIAFALTLGLGNMLLEFHVAENFIFPFLFALGAALPTLVVLAWSGRRLGWPVTWRQGALLFVAGSTLSVGVAIILESILPMMVYVILTPLDVHDRQDLWERHVVIFAEIHDRAHVDMPDLFQPRED